MNRKTILSATFTACAAAVLAVLPGPDASAEPGTAVSFRSGDTTLHATVSAPTTEGRHPGLVLVQGAGPETRAKYQAEAEALTRAGFVVLNYDKRTAGYSQTHRSYSQLADDALAAVSLLRSRADVDPARVGLWGFSEGAWVAPIAASRSQDVAFLVLVGASGVAPARQQAWSMENRLRHDGVTGPPLRSVAVTGTRTLVAAGLFPEADYDPVPALRQVGQPVLAMWGNDRQSPPAESATILRSALAAGGNTDVTLRFFPEGDHKLHRSPDGFQRLGDLTPGYVDAVAAWVAGDGHRVTAPFPTQQRVSAPLPALGWYESPLIQAVVVLALVGVFVGCGLIRPPAPVRRAARWLAATGLVAVLGLLGYLGYVTSTLAAEPVLAGRPVVWLILQATAVGTVVAAVVTAIGSWRRRTGLSGVQRLRTGALLAASGLFVAWTIHWGLLVA